MPFHPPRSFMFPKRQIGSKTRYCQRSWFDTFKFLHYDVNKDAVFCQLHVHPGGAAAEAEIHKAKHSDSAFVSVKYI